MKVIVATGNAHKLVEIKQITSKLGWEVVSQVEAGLGDIDVEETGTTFEENSLLKAKEISKITGLPTIADDSGLAVDYLDGAPGVYSARYSGWDGPRSEVDVHNNDKLLYEMRDAKPAIIGSDGYTEDKGERSARYVSVITLYIPAVASDLGDSGDSDATVIVARGECEGVMLTERHGDGGFGYDPLFLPDGQTATFAQMGLDEKNKISHRAKALAKLEKQIEGSNL
ncbi:MAG: RdgB/HAM1 family non-canonical purine NTP pyrophosphatase [Clostridiales Family XIII bacterium]|nr:RdgB/HAM1 family non-canonical purine NTP pyrophosphatase [Clostridiales Family XIII bacterium]